MYKKLLLVLLLLSLFSCSVSKKNTPVTDTIASDKNKFSTDMDSMLVMKMKLADVHYFLRAGNRCKNLL
ncbi:MAG: hypothetical protein JXB50_05590 [Spirochaetes bacterium]|nr:hypothetical protein [Spirochaetota bacterium]